MKKIYVVLLLSCFAGLGFGQINLSASLTACYGLNGTGNEPINNLTATLSAVTPTVNRLGNPNSAFAFNGSDSSFIKLPNSPLLKPTRVSFSCWLKLDALPSNYNIIVFAQNNCSSFYEGYAMGIRNVGGLRKFGIAKSSNACSGFSQSLLECNWGAAAQTWYHLGFYIGPDSMKVYVNGALNVSMASPNPIDYDPTLNIYLGGTATTPNGPLLGSMDNVRFYNRKLNNAEFNQLYIQDPSCFGVPPVASFSISPTSVCPGQTIAFSDQSTNAPTAWSWQMPGATPAVSTSSSPVASFPNPGAYIVSLVSTNAAGSSNTSTTAITIQPLPLVTISGNRSICKGNSLILTAAGAASYTWSNLQTSATINVSPLSTTVYSVNGTGANGCTNVASISVVVDLCTGILKNNADDNLSVFPNPGSGIFTLDFSEPFFNGIIVYNVLGEVVLKISGTSGPLKIDLTDRPGGVYFIELKSGQKLVTKKIIME